MASQVSKKTPDPIPCGERGDERHNSDREQFRNYLSKMKVLLSMQFAVRVCKESRILLPIELFLEKALSVWSDKLESVRTAMCGIDPLSLTHNE